MNQDEMLRQLRSDPVGMAKQKGFNIPDELSNDPKAMVMHLMQTNQISSPMLQRIMPMIRMMTGK